MGGITVLQELSKRFLGLEFLYFGDTANVPYGSKSPAQIKALVHSAAERIKTKRIDALVIACNTASSLAYEELKSVFPNTPLIDVVEAGVRSSIKASLADPGLPLVVLGTKATVRSHIYHTLLHEKAPSLQVFEQACPLLVPLIEEGWIDHPVLHATLQEYVKPFQGQPHGIALLACTHYPWIEEAVKLALPGWSVLNSAHAVADILAEQFPELTLGDGPSKIEWYFSDPEGVSKILFQDSTDQISSF
jgi:glutamate racemase